MRGARARRAANTDCHGIIPAYAGSTTQKGISWTLVRDHPRVCGEHDTERNIMDFSKGSSPRMRGAPLEDMWPALYRGIIPAYAGSTRR